MKTDLHKKPAKVELIAATLEQRPIIANLIELYVHDFSEFHEVELGEDGRFGYSELPRYWSEANRFPFLVRVDDKLAGFVLVKGADTAQDQKSWDMAEFFVLRSYRRSGIGSEVARQVWMRFPGRWQVRVMDANEAGRRFWERAITASTGNDAAPERVERNGHL